MARPTGWTGSYPTSHFVRLSTGFAGRFMVGVDLSLVLRRYRRITGSISHLEQLPYPGVLEVVSGDGECTPGRVSLPQTFL